MGLHTQVLGNPSGEVLGKFKRNGAAHVDFDFATQKGIGVAQLIPHAATECVDLITKVRKRRALYLDNSKHRKSKRDSVDEKECSCFD